MSNIEAVSESISTPSVLETKSKRARAPNSDGWYAHYVLVVLTLVFLFNTLDRSIFTILAEDIKTDLELTDSQLGFLAGAAFAVFYATFGMVLSRLADLWNRKKLITIGLGFWSIMTALSGVAKSYFPLSACRFGVAVGESSATPAAYSMLYDYFSPKVRTTVLSIYSSGGIVGSAAGLFVGGLILDTWNSAYPVSTVAPLGLAGWQAAFVIVGLPGLLMALWLSTLREPVRGQGDGVSCPVHPTPFREAGCTLISILPVFNLWYLGRQGGIQAVAINLIAGSVIVLVVGCLLNITGDTAQWLAVGVGTFAAVSWVQDLYLRDRVVAGLIFYCKTNYFLFLHAAMFGIGMTIATFWAVPYVQRTFGVSAGEVGAVLGPASAISGFLGMLIGGMLADRLRTRFGQGKIFVLIGALICMGTGIFLLTTTTSLIVAYIAVILAQISMGLASGPTVSTINDLMLPRGRATVTAFFFTVTYLSAGSIAPYLIGQMSDLIAANGIDSGESLRNAMLLCFTPAFILNIVCVLLAMRFVNGDEASMLARARALGENL